MNIEQNRLETFNEWPSDASVSPQRIAKAGFYYTKRDLEVECFSCGLKISDWNYGDQVMARHKTLSPRCSFVLNPATSGNVPSLVSVPVIPVTFPDFKNESTRLASFENWPVSDIVSPEDLARAGFYYMKSGDKTKCAFCSGVVRAWERNDIPDVEHKRHFPLCPFVLTVINGRLEHGENTTEQPHTTQAQRHLSVINNMVDNNLEELGVHKHNGPKRPDYGTVESRLRSFASWSPHLIQTPDLLAQAGFYYEGPDMGDQVRCFHCDGGLRHWDPDDDPWTEHARWFPKCSFVNLVKGQEFVSACSLDNGDLSTMQQEKVQTSMPKRPVSEEELRSHMISEAALSALGIGIDVQRVRRAIKEKLEKTGRGYSQPDALVEAALNMQLEEDDNFDNATSGGEHLRDFAMQIANIIHTKEKIARSIPPQENAETGDGPPDSSSKEKMDKAAMSLEEENRLLKEARQCKICMDAEVGVVFVPCGHLATCVNCAPNLEDCPVCRTGIKCSVRTFLS